jgi:hypothetical protein
MSEVNTFQNLAAKKPIKCVIEWCHYFFPEIRDARLVMVKIGDTSTADGSESALCMDMRGDIARVVDPDNNGVMRKLAAGQVRICKKNVTDVFFIYLGIWR